MLRAITLASVVVALAFIVWAFFVMTGGRDWLVATMTTETKVAETVPPKPAAPAEEEQAKPAEEAKPVEEARPEETAEAEGAPPPSEGESEIASGAETEGTTVDPDGNPFETAQAAEKGTLVSPYLEDYDSVADEGRKKYMAAGCNGCHGGTGGGGMGPPLTNPIWVYGNDGDTLFRLIALGTPGLQEQGYTRKGSELVVGPMPPHGNIVKSNDDMWKIIGWIWSINPPDPDRWITQ